MTKVIALNRMDLRLTKFNVDGPNYNFIVLLVPMNIDNTQMNSLISIDDFIKCAAVINLKG